MYLKSIEMLGFKSFAEKTRLDFHPGVTSIVGPNGCGKSNVLDAIRWVLGEQSPKALRGSEMADVIFNGTDSRKQIGMAEVSMTFAGCREALKTDYDEVTVSRRVFRDGKGEYEINRTPCRLRDIHHLFMDTGIGRTAYSIMEQGKIDKVLSSRPEDRREIFEEAAGITKYKAQRKEALRKLEYTESNLLRLADIIREVSRQIGSLQRQANKARRYKEIHDRLRDIELRIGARAYRDFSTRVGALETAIAELDRAIAEMGEKVSTEEVELEQWRAHGAEIETALENSRQERANATAAVERAEGQRSLNVERLADLDKSDASATADIASAEERAAIQKKDLGAIDGDVDAVAAELRACRDHLAQAVRQLGDCTEMTGKRQSEIGGRRERLTAAEQELQSLVAQIGGWDVQKRTHVLRVEAANKELERAKAQLEQERETNAGVEAELAAARVRRTEAGDEVAARKVRLRDVAESLEVRSRRRAEVEQRLAGIKSQLDLLKRMAASHEGIGSAAQAVIAASGKGALEGVEVREALADAIKIEPGAEAAIGVLLGDRVGALLLEDTRAVRKILAFLKSSGSGRLILAPSIFPRVRWKAPAREESALKLVTAGGAARRLLEVLLGHAYVAEDIERALKLKAELPHAIIATKDGHLITPEGIIVSGVGEDVARGGLLTRRREMSDLEAKLAKASEELDEAISQEEAVRIQRDEADKRVEQVAADLMATDEAMRIAEREWHVWEKRREDLQQRIAGIEAEIRHIGTSGDEMDEHERAQMRRRDEFSQVVETFRLELKGAEAELPALLGRESELNARVLELRVSGAALEEKEVGLRARRAPLAALVADLEETCRLRRAVIEANAARRAQFLEENERLAKQVEEGRGQIAQLEEYLKALQAQRTAALEAIRSREEDLKGRRRQQHEKQEERGRIDVELARIRMDLEALVLRIHRAYRVELAEYAAGAPAPAVAGAEPPEPGKGEAPAAPELEAAEGGVAEEAAPEPDWAQLEVEAGQLRERLDSMGPVNLEAITEYDELEARHRFLEEQQRDLLNSKEQLMQAIARINRTSRQLFAETFEKVAVNFQQTFSELFGGGKATLSLMDEADPLESGIDISAKPPGKQLAHITLLSGGERTMTAVALLFAIYMVRPSPFCILDEMDAPLDESNINRFIDMLKRFVLQSQFLLITHNKRTIGMADALYGVTMEESGVSKVVSVRFRTRGDEGEGVVDTATDGTEAGSAQGETGA
ncbi:MAG TPA: chromosome segregation protein SMC [Verrucomicrobiae bacterium]|nr:chromosome segregation protein SMC [Verrucomicrobiae bacterium]